MRERHRHPNRPHGGLSLVALAMVVAAAGWVFSSGPTEPSEPGTADLPPGIVAPLAPSPAPADSNRQYDALARATDHTTVVLTRSRLEMIDLDTGLRTTVPLPGPVDLVRPGAGLPLLVSGGSLVIPGGPVVWIVELDTGEVTDLGAGDRVAPALTTDHLWVLRADRAVWVEFDEHGSYLRDIAWPANALPWDHGAGTPELAWLPGGGIYGLEPDGRWSLVVEGVPVAAAGTTALVQQCVTPVECHTRWFDMASGATLDRALPSAAFDLNARPYRLSPTTEAFVEVVPTPDSRFGVFTWKDRVVRRTECGENWRTAAWSTDESLFACVSDQGVTVTDLRDGVAVTFGNWAETPLAVILIPSATIGFVN